MQSIQSFVQRRYWTFEGDRGPQSAPPPLAPLSLAGLSLMGTVILLGRRDKS